MIQKIINKICHADSNPEVVSTIDEIPANIYINDARSAAFYAFGQERKGSGAILVLNGYELQSAYTAITEAWFQKANLYVVAIFDKINGLNTNFLNRCVNKTIFIENEEELNKIDSDFVKVIGPKLIKVMGKNVNVEKNNYNDLISDIKKINNDIEIITYNAKDEQKQNISEMHKYGILSKYLGKTAVSDKSSILLCTADIFLLDLNIFNSRYVSEKFKILVVDKDNVIKKKKIDDWISSNEIKVYYGREHIEELISNAVPGVLIVGGEA